MLIPILPVMEDKLDISSKRIEKLVSGLQKRIIKLERNIEINKEDGC